MTQFIDDKNISLAIRRGKLQAFECWNQTGIIVPSARQHKTTWLSDQKFVGFRVQRRIFVISFVVGVCLLFFLALKL